MKTQFEELMRGLDDVESFLSGEKEEPSATIFEPTISTHDSHVSHDFSRT
jgi:hypothetical protein